jgi:hypothetical protein
VYLRKIQRSASDSRQPDSDNHEERFDARWYFCTVCGTTLFTEFEVDPAHVSIKACSLDDPSGFEPDRHLFISRKQPWLHLNDHLTLYEHDC